LCIKPVVFLVVLTIGCQSDQLFPACLNHLLSTQTRLSLSVSVVNSTNGSTGCPNHRVSIQPRASLAVSVIGCQLSHEFHWLSQKTVLSSQPNGLIGRFNHWLSSQLNSLTGCPNLTVSYRSAVIRPSNRVSRCCPEIYKTNSSSYELMPIQNVRCIHIYTYIYKYSQVMIRPHCLVFDSNLPSFRYYMYNTYI
jgi:hypothetical protein